MIDRVKVALAFCKADERIVASIPDPWLPGCVATVVETPQEHLIGLFYLDRAGGVGKREGRLGPTECDMLKCETSIMAVSFLEVKTLSLVELNALVERRFADALNHFRNVSLWDPDTFWIEPMVLRSLAIS